MLKLSLTLLAVMVCLVAVQAKHVRDEPAVTTAAPVQPCTCGNWLGLHCGTRANNGETGASKVYLTGDCEAIAFYQCSEIQRPAVFKGYCPNCQVNGPGQDLCLSPTWKQTMHLH